MERQTPSLHKYKTKCLSKKFFSKLYQTAEKKGTSTLLLARAESAAMRGATLASGGKQRKWSETSEVRKRP